MGLNIRRQRYSALPPEYRWRYCTSDEVYWKSVDPKCWLCNRRGRYQSPRVNPMFSLGMMRPWDAEELEEAATVVL